MGSDVDQTSLGEPSHAPDIILLIWERRLTYLRHLVSAGALVIALGFMIEPFLQAIISDYERLVDMDASTLNNSRAVNRAASMVALNVFPSTNQGTRRSRPHRISQSVLRSLMD